MGRAIDALITFRFLKLLVTPFKKLIEKLPGGKTRIASYAAALFLIKENTEMDDFTLLEKEFHKYLKDNDLIEPYHDGIIREVIDFADKLTKGQYKLVNDIYTDKSTEVVAKKGDTVSVFGDTGAIDTIMGVEIFPVVHDKSKNEIYISIEDLEEIE
jgi:hypothetical protein